MSKQKQFTIEDIQVDFENYINKEYLSQSLKAELIKSDILILPEEGFKDRDIPVFPVKTEELFIYLRNKNLNIEICIDDEQYVELALHGDLRRLGIFVVKKVILPIFISVLAAYIANKVLKTDETNKVKLEIVVVDSTKAKKINFEGSAKDFIELSNDIKNFWDDK
jgi:hypothetical protein